MCDDPVASFGLPSHIGMKRLELVGQSPFLSMSNGTVLAAA
jgi:hypothetical protein